MGIRKNIIRLGFLFFLLSVIFLSFCLFYISGFIDRKYSNSNDEFKQTYDSMMFIKNEYSVKQQYFPPANVVHDSKAAEDIVSASKSSNEVKYPVIADIQNDIHSTTDSFSQNIEINQKISTKYIKEKLDSNTKKTNQGIYTKEEFIVGETDPGLLLRKALEIAASGDTALARELIDQIASKNKKYTHALSESIRFALLQSDSKAALKAFRKLQKQSSSKKLLKNIAKAIKHTENKEFASALMVLEEMKNEKQYK